MTVFKRRPNRLVRGSFATGLTGAMVAMAWIAVNAVTSSVWAQDVIKAPAPTLSAAKLSGASSPNRPAIVSKNQIKPTWQDLSPSQQQSLTPLAEQWNTLGETQKRKWIAIAANYPKLAAPEQAKLHSRMTEWVSLSPQQRAQARLNFAESKKLTPTQKAATWTAYQALSPEEKQKLARSAPPKTVGAATAVKPVSPQKLAAVPVTKQTAKQAPKMAATGHSLDRNTLLPRSRTASEPQPVPSN